MTNLKNLLTFYGLLNEISIRLTRLTNNMDDTEEFELIEFDLNDQILNLNYSESFYGFMQLKGHLINIQRLFKAKNFDHETETMKILIKKSLVLIGIIKEELS